MAQRSGAQVDYDLTRRERMVLSLLAGGRTNKEIAELLYISLPTVATHVSRILRKMDAPSRTEAATRAIREGLVR